MTAQAEDESVEVVSKRLRDFLSARLGDDADVTVTGLQRSGQGSSRENWPFDASWRDADGIAVHKRLLLRRDPPTAVVDTGRAMEFELLKALEPTPVPTPVVHWLDDSGAELLRPSMIVEQYSGSADRAVLRDKNPLRLSDTARVDLAREMCDVLADLHTLDLDATGLRSVLPAPDTTPGEQELARWEDELAAAELEPQPVLRWALRWLWDHVPPAPARDVLVHGDFRPANVLVDEGRVRVLLDWELAHLGDPLDDLGWYCAPLYAREHFIPGAWTQKDFLRRYAERTGIDVDPGALRFWQTFTVFRLAVIALQGVRIFCEGGSDRPAAPLPRVLIRHLLDVLTDAGATGKANGKD